MAFHKILTLLGGDSRQFSLAARLARAGFSVRCFGMPPEHFGPEITVYTDWQTAIADATAVILPLPASPDGVRVNLPLAPAIEPPLFEELFDGLSPGSLLIGGKFTPAIKARAEEKGVFLFDYFDSERLQEKNALPTAEGAISILMREVPRTVAGLPVAVTGFGRVARAVVRLLLAMGAEVTVAARKREALSEAADWGCHTVPIVDGTSLLALTHGQSVIVNTVPHWIFSREILKEMPRGTLLLDLASAPGGIDAAAATAYGLRVIWALSLPGKYAPATAGEIIADTLLEELFSGGGV